MSDLGSNGVKYPALWINLTLALELGWFVEDVDEADPQFAYKLGPNLCVQLHDHEIPSTTDIVSFNTAAGVAEHVAYRNKYWIRPCWYNGNLMIPYASVLTSVGDLSIWIMRLVMSPNTLRDPSTSIPM